ncbi:zingipain-2-like [Neltuma alba]|uniref:zingipain-2-like n=1 Tax=Neltuma alba TaxID=207710 RepID=UPI0010A44F5C|nr:zingipain-2-like [Prosopis alba]
MTYEEFSKMYLHETEEPIMEINNRKMILNDASCPDAPSSWDWRTKGAVTPVKNQGRCGGCWAFSATGAMEGINQIVSQRLLELSEQQLISCSTSNGCKGGWYVNGFKYVINNGGIASEKAYPYTANDSACNPKAAENTIATIDGYNYWRHKPISESSLRCYVYKQPISVSIYASSHFMRYKSGIFNGDDCSGISSSCKHNHAVLIVGYGSTSDGQDYWIVKNSWGTTWGQSGYILIKRNTGATRGVCNINCSGAYPTKAKKEPALKLATSI